MTALRIAGGLLAAVGLVFAIAPTLAYDPGPAADLFETIERRIPWGGVLGFGALLIARTRLKPWGVTIASFALWVTGGFLAARFLGLALDGAGSAKQWMWVGVEALIVAVAGVYLWRKRDATEPEPEAANEA